MNEITYTCAGINHQAFYLKYEWNGKDAYPLIRKAITEKPEIYNEEQVRNEMFLALGYYVTESSGHNSEYNWWFRKRPDLIEKYCTHGTGWNPGEYAYILKEYSQPRRAPGRKTPRHWFAKETPISLERGHEYAAYIINAACGGEVFSLQRQRAQHQADHQPARRRLRRSAGLRRQSRFPPGACRRAAAPAGGPQPHLASWKRK